MVVRRAERRDDLSPIERLQRRFDHLVLKPTKHGVRYRCPVCQSVVTHDGEGMEPCCTGPSWRDEHPLTVTVRLPD